MKNHAIIPIFIPHLGCKNDCVFCNQKAITTKQSVPTYDDVIATIEAYLSTLSKKKAENNMIIEIAFYGGSFTGLTIDEQNFYLNIAKEYLDAGKIDGIHLSTRPDYIDKEILENLKAHGVSTIELGVQSFDDKVLLASNRGHDSKCIYEAAKLIKDYGFSLGIQLMIGLPGDSLESCVFSAKEACKLQPSLCRLYPTIVLEDTKLCEMYHEGTYEPYSLEESVKITAKMYRILENAGIYIMRVGLKSNDEVAKSGEKNGGTFHPAYRQLVESCILREDILKEIKDHLALNQNQYRINRIPGNAPREVCTKIEIYSNPRWFSSLVGNRSENRKYFEAEFPTIKFSFKVDSSLENRDIHINYIFELIN